MHVRTASIACQIEKQHPKWISHHAYQSLVKADVPLTNYGIL